MAGPLSSSTLRYLFFTHVPSFFLLVKPLPKNRLLLQFQNFRLQGILHPCYYGSRFFVINLCSGRDSNPSNLMNTRVTKTENGCQPREPRTFHPESGIPAMSERGRRQRRQRRQLMELVNSYVIKIDSNFWEYTRTQPYRHFKVVSKLLFHEHQ